MRGFIPLDKTIQDFQKLLKRWALAGKPDITPKDIIDQLRAEPVYNVDYVIDKVKSLLVAENEKTNCITGDDTEHVVVTGEKLDQVLDVIREGGIKDESDE